MPPSRAGLWATFMGCVRGGGAAVQVTAERQCCGYLPHLGVYRGHRVTTVDEFSSSVWHRVSGCGNDTHCHEGFLIPVLCQLSEGTGSALAAISEQSSSSSEGMNVSSSLKCAEQTMAWSE